LLGRIYGGIGVRGDARRYCQLAESSGIATTMASPSLETRYRIRIGDFPFCGKLVFREGYDGSE
jgi:hypothetical protein